MDSPYQNQIDSGFGILFVIYMLFVVAVYVVTVIGLWKMYVKAGRPGWAAIVPVYNWWVWVEIIERPRWWFWVLVGSVLLSWVPIVGIVLSVAMFVLYLLGCLDMAKRFGQGTGYGIGLWLLPFVFAPILGFGSARFQGSGSGYAATATWQAAPEDTMVPPPPAPPAAPAPLMTAPTPIWMPPAPAESMPPAPLPPMPPAPLPPIPPAPAESLPAAPTPIAPAESLPAAAPTPVAPAESMPAAPLPPAPAESTPMPSSTAPAPAPAPPDGTVSPPPYTLAPPKSPVPPLGSWPPAPPKK